MAVRLLLLVASVLVLGAAGTAHAANPALTGDVGVDDSFTITLAGPDGAKVTHLDPGTYDLTIHDHSAFHDFHLSGDGVDVATAVEFVGDRTVTVTLTGGVYLFVCDPHSDRMRGTFTVGATTAPPPAPVPPVTPAAPPPVRLAGAIGPGTKIALGPVAGLSAGPFAITVRDTSASDGFRLAGPGLSRSTSAKFRGAVTWKVTLAPGRYTFGSLRHPKLRRSFTVAG